MKEIIIIRDKAPQIKKMLDQKGFNYELYQEPVKVKTDKLREYIEMKSKEDIFANYGEALKDKEREKEIALWEKADEEDEKELSKIYGR
jgi:cysteinyl-tRNA synthetase